MTDTREKAQDSEWPVIEQGWLVIDDHCEDGHWSGFASSRRGGNIVWDTEAIPITVHITQAAQESVDEPTKIDRSTCQTPAAQESAFKFPDDDEVREKANERADYHGYTDGARQWPEYDCSAHRTAYLEGFRECYGWLEATFTLSTEPDTAKAAQSDESGWQAIGETRARQMATLARACDDAHAKIKELERQVDCLESGLVNLRLCLPSDHKAQEIITHFLEMAGLFRFVRGRA